MSDLEHDAAVIAAQLGRPHRGIHAIGHRCPCGNPDVVTTEPRLPNGTPFPTTFYLTCPRAASLISIRFPLIPAVVGWYCINSRFANSTPARKASAAAFPVFS